MLITLICVGKLKEDYWRAAQREYAKRLRIYSRLEVVEVPEAICRDERKPHFIQMAIREEGERILPLLKKMDLAIALDRWGKLLDSEGWARYLAGEAAAGRSRIGLAIGGSYGLAPEVLASSRLVWSFSPLTFPHQLMRVMVLEQIYRGFKIINREAYHK
ncbi:MAG: 23S rRNA (pseudouridine(1915)-N(3))-methyltransferase RlmH [Bacillota bacterium]